MGAHMDAKSNVMKVQSLFFPFFFKKKSRILGELIWRENERVRRKVGALFHLGVLLVTKERGGIRKGRDLTSLHKSKNNNNNNKSSVQLWAKSEQKERELF